MKSRLVYFTMVSAMLACFAAHAWAQQNPLITALSAEWAEPVVVEGVEILHVQKDVYMLVTSGANVTLQIGEGGATLVDAGANAAEA